MTLILLGLLFSPSVSHAEDSIAWVARFASPDGDDDMLMGIFIDSSGKNIYMVAGSKREDPLSLACDVCTDTRILSDIYLIKYDSLGQQRWVRRENGRGNLPYDPISVKMDESKNICITGITKNPKENNAFHLLKYDTTGEKILDKTYGNSVNFPKYIWGWDIDDSSTIFQCGTNNISADSLEINVLKYDTAGKIVWKRKFRPKGYKEIWNLDFHITEDEGIYLAITAEHPTRWLDWVVVKLSLEGTVQWEKIYKDTGKKAQILNDNKIDEQGNIFLTGEIYNEDGNSDFCTMKIDSLGNTVWVNQYNGPENLNDIARHIETDNEGNIYVGGESVIRKVGMDHAIRLIKYDSLGNQLWVKTKSHPKADYNFTSMTIDNDNIYITGLVNSGSWDTLSYIAVLKYDTSGNQVWIKNYNKQVERIYYEDGAVEFDRRGNIYVLGISGIAGEDNDDILFIKYRGW